MSNFIVLHKLLKKGNSISVEEAQLNLKLALLKQFSGVYRNELLENNNLEREFLFLCMYYGLIEPALTLEGIGKAQIKHELTRERVRQIIDSVLGLLNTQENPYEAAKDKVSVLLEEKNTIFLKLDELFALPYFESFKKNIKGLISFLNDCGIKQVAYRKEYYIYLQTTKRPEVIKSIQRENKEIRKTQTLNKMAQKAKTVTYVPHEVKLFLCAEAKTRSIGLNELYEIIFRTFITNNPYHELAYTFPKTKSWKARKGTAKWEQIGIYIEKDLFEKVKSIVKRLKKDKRSVSFMSFICQSFIWFYNQHPQALNSATAQPDSLDKNQRIQNLFSEPVSAAISAE